MNHKRYVLPLVLISCWMGWADKPILQYSRADDSRDQPAIPMHLDLDMESDTYLVGENFPLRLRIVNPNPFDVSLCGFEFGYDRPKLELSIPEEDEFRAFPRGAHDSAMRRMPVTIRTNSAIERERILYRNFAMDQWFMPPGRYRLRASSDLYAVRVDGQDGIQDVDWTSETATFTLRMPIGSERRALEFLRERWSEFHRRLSRPGPGFDSTKDSLKIRREFLERYEDSVYAAEVRWALAKQLLSEFGNNRVAEEDVPEMIDLFEKCFTFCLDQGGAYTEELLRLGSYSPAESAMRITTRYKKIDLLKRIVKELDKKYPDDKEGNLYRRLFVANATGSTETATKLARAMLKQFPNGKHARYAEHVLKQDPQTKESIDAGGQ